MIVVGAGPAGLVAAARARRLGLEVTVLERDRVGASLARWGPTRLFTPFRMNLPEDLRGLLGRLAPDPERLLSAGEMIGEVLEPLAAHPLLAGTIRTGHRVVAIGRAGLSRGELPGHPLRGERPFRVLAETPQGEVVFEAEGVLDASGSGAPAPIGSGGIPAVGEHEHRGAVVRHLGDLERALSDLAGGRVFLLGHGHSAATALGRLAALATRDADLRVTWAVRTANARPCAEVADDPLPERRRTVTAANALAADPPPWLTVERRAGVERIARHGAEFSLELAGGRRAAADAVAAFTGYVPDVSYLRELALEAAPATEGTAGLERALSRVTDCLTVPQVSPADLSTGEPGFFFAGARSYGRARTFLLQTGYAHLETMLGSLVAPVTA